MYRLINSEFIKWAGEEAERIKQGKAKPYHAVLCDPPYGLEFMGKDWDTPGVDLRQPEAGVTSKAGPFRRAKVRHGYSEKEKPTEAFEKQVETWGFAMLPLLQPGAIVMMFGGTRMWHRLATGMENAGFRLWDTLMWVYASGFPKGQDISKLIDRQRGDKRKVVGKRVLTGNAGISTKEKGGTYSVATGISRNVEVVVTAPGSDVSYPWAGHKSTALKPAWEPLLCFRAPCEKNFAEAALEYGSGALNIDGTRIGESKNVPGGAITNTRQVYGPFSGDSPELEITKGRDPTYGRYPANLALECTCEKTASAIEESSTITSDDSGKPNFKNKVYGKGFGGAKWSGKTKRVVEVHTDPNCPCYQLDAQSGDVPGAFCPNPSQPDYESVLRFGTVNTNRGPRGYSDAGGASRFFFTSKASRYEREEGLTYLQSSVPGQGGGKRVDIKNVHPT